MHLSPARTKNLKLQQKILAILRLRQVRLQRQACSKAQPLQLQSSQACLQLL